MVLMCFYFAAWAISRSDLNFLAIIGRLYEASNIAKMEGLLRLQMPEMLPHLIEHNGMDVLIGGDDLLFEGPQHHPLLR